MTTILQRARIKRPWHFVAQQRNEMGESAAQTHAGGNIHKFSGFYFENPDIKNMFAPFRRLAEVVGQGNGAQ